MATKRDLEKEHFNRVGLMIVFGGSALIWAILLALILS
jgi:hypothetical protein